MFKNIRRNIALALFPASKQEKRPLGLTSFLTPGIPTYTEMSIRKATREGYKLSIYVYRAIRTIVQAGSGIPWIVLDKNGEEIKNHEFTKAWSRPNPEFSGQDNMEFIIAHLKLVGNSIIQPIMVNGRPKEFWICMPDKIHPIPADVKGEWLKGYQVTEAGGNQHTVPPETFIHFMQFDPGNPYWGIGDLMAAARTVDTDNEAQDTQKVSMQNRGLPSGVFKHTAELTPEQFEEQNRRIQEIFLEKTKRRAPWVLGAGAEWQQMSLTPVEMDYIASRLQNKRDVAAAFGVDPWFLGDNEHSSYNNILEAKKALYESTVIPLLDDVRSTLNLRIAPMYGEGIYITYDLSNIVAIREDYGKKVLQAKDLWSMGIPFEQVNDQLEMGFEEFPGWDRGYLPFNLMPAGSTPPAEQEPAKMMTKALNLETEEQKTAHWKRIDRRRVGWWGVVNKKLRPLYSAEADAVAKAIKGTKPDSLTKKANAAIESLQPEWEKTMTAITTALVEDFGNEIAEDLGGEPKSAKPTELKWVFDPFKPSARRWIGNHTAMSIKTILDTNKADVKAIVMRGFDENQTTSQIAKQIRQFYTDQSPYKAMRVARTEVGAAAGFGQREAALQSGVVKTHRFLSSRDDRVRDSHIALDGEEKPIDEPYSNGQMFPGDPSVDPSDFVNCRCVETYHTGR